VALDVGSDSLADVLARLEALPLGLVASYDAASGRVALQSPGPLALDDGGTRFFETVGIATGAQRSLRRRAGLAGRVARAGLRELARAWNALFAADFGRGGPAGRQAERLRSALVTVAREALEGRRGGDSGRVLRSGRGLDLEHDHARGSRLELDLGRLERALREDDAALGALLLGDGRGERGLLAALEDALGASVAALGAVLERRGLAFLDLRA
jgi:hypothetical protein